MPVTVTFGEVMLRLSAPGQERLFQSSHLHTWWGGAEANVAMGLAALGVPTRHVSRLPTTAIGNAALRALMAEGVDTQEIIRGGERLGLFFCEAGAAPRERQTLYDLDQSSFGTLDPMAFDWKRILSDASWFHVSTVTAALGARPARAVAEALATAHRMGVRTSLALNLRSPLWGGRDPRPIVEPLVLHASMLIGNPGEIERMLGIPTDGDLPEQTEAINRTARRVHEQFGCARVLVTQRQDLSIGTQRVRAHGWEADEDTFWSTPWHEVAVVDRVGSSDSFVAAYLYAQRQGYAMGRALQFAAAASALKLTIPGDVNRVTVREIESYLASHPEM